MFAKLIQEYMNAAFLHFHFQANEQNEGGF